jgi:hypothetical protein
MSHAYARTGGRTEERYVHRRVYEEHHGPIPEGWHVHHVDWDKRNNDPSNLVALTPAEHSAIHLRKYPTTHACVVCGDLFAPAPKKAGRTKTCSEGCRRESQRRSMIARRGR